MSKAGTLVDIPGIAVIGLHMGYRVRRTLGGTPLSRTLQRPG